MSRRQLLQVIALLASCLAIARAFAPNPTLQHRMAGLSSRGPMMPSSSSSSSSTTSVVSIFQPASLQRQRKSVANVQTMGLFGLGAPEIGIILVAAAFLLGPDKLASLGKDAGKIAGELKEVPKEFQKGLEEGEAQAKALKAKSETESASVDAEVTQKEEATK